MFNPILNKKISQKDKLNHEFAGEWKGKWVLWAAYFIFKGVQYLTANNQLTFLPQKIY